MSAMEGMRENMSLCKISDGIDVRRSSNPGAKSRVNFSRNRKYLCKYQYDLVTGKKQSATSWHNRFVMLSFCRLLLPLKAGTNYKLLPIKSQLLPPLPSQTNQHALPRASKEPQLELKILK